LVAYSQLFGGGILFAKEFTAMDGLNKFIVNLTAEARERLESIARNGSAPAKKIMHARVLLMSDQHHQAGRYHDHQIAAALGIHINTVARIRKAYVLRGEGPALDRKPRPAPPTPPKLDGHDEALLVAICCSPPPQGRVRWTLSLLRQEMVGRKIVTSICRETIRKTLKKTRSSPGASSVSAFPSAIPLASSPRWSRCSTSTRSRRTMTSH
jgi:transposase